MKSSRLLIIPLILTLLVNLSACGTILYPERKGQISGRIDPGVAILNGIGLLFYIIPGVIAFAVDFSNGTIYLPKRKAGLSTEDTVNVVKTPRDIDTHLLEQVINDEFQLDVNLNNPNIVVEHFSSLEEINQSIRLM